MRCQPAHTCFRAFAIALTLALASCRATYPAAPTTTDVSLLLLGGMTESLTWQGYAFRAFTLRADGAYEEVTETATWSSSDTAVMTPRAPSGYFWAAAAGTSVITVRKGSLVASRTVAVLDSGRLTYPRLSYTQGADLTPGASSYFTLWWSEVRTNNGWPYIWSGDVTSVAAWTSDNPSIVRVSGSALTGVSVGLTMVRASYNGISIEVLVSVYPSR